MMLRSLIFFLLILPTFAAENIKAVGAVSKANIKALGAVAEANIKALGAVDNTGGGGGSITHIDAKGAGGNLATYTTAAFTATAGDTLLGWVHWESTTVTLTSVTDGANTYTLLHNPTTGDDSARVAMFYCVGVAGGSPAVSANLSGAAFGQIIVHQIRGAASFDKSAIQEQIFPGTAADAVSSGNVTTISDGQYIFGASAKTSASGNVLSAGTGFTQGVQQNNSGAASLSEYQIQGSAGAIAATFTTSSDGPYLTGIMTFSP